MAKNLPVEELATYANSYASAHGIQVEKKQGHFECAPMSLLPNAYPKKAFEQAKYLAPHFNALVDRTSRDGEFLVESLGRGVSENDPYTAKLLELYKDIYLDSENFAKTADRLGIHRSDYMLNRGEDGTEYALKQIELNTIAASFAGLSVNISALHRHLVARFGGDIQEFLKEIREAVSGKSAATMGGGVPENPALRSVPLAMKVAHERYASRFVSSGVSPAILFVVQEGETNTVDQRLLEFRLWEDHEIPVVRMSLTRANSELTLDEETGALIITKTGREISVVYFRAGYAPTDYPDGYDGIEWKARATLERSRATKAPSLGYHLAGTKKVQQELARPGVLERFFKEDDGTVSALRSAFAGLYSLGEDATESDIAAVRDALSGKEGSFVLKPQREGGGYNYYGDSLATKLRENVSDKPSGLELGKSLGEFILMERLFPPKQTAVLLRSGKVEGSGDSVSELGCYGTLVVSPDGEILHNEYAGFLLRTKFSDVDEGGVASGFATLSSPYLC